MNTQRETITNPGVIQVGFHTGHILSYLSQLYSHPTDAIRECVQNAIDKRATHIRIEIDCLLETIHVIDDGEGASYEEVEAKFQAIGKSLKLSDPEALGEKGVGNLAGIAIADVYQLITRDTKDCKDRFRVYTLDRNKFRDRPDVSLEAEAYPGSTVMKSVGFNPSAIVRLRNVNAVALKRLHDIDSIVRCLADAFSSKIRTRGIEVRVSYRDLKNRRSETRVQPVTFRGTPMPPEEWVTPPGKVIFELTCSPTPIPHPAILIDHRGYTLPLSNLFKLRQLDPETEKIFSRGFFEGTIRLSFCTLNSARHSFEWDKELEHFVTAVHDFAVDILEPLIEGFEDQERESKYKRVSDAIMKKMADFFKINPSLFPDKLKSFITRSGGSESVVGSRVKVPVLRPKPTVPPTLIRDQVEKRRRRGSAPRKKGRTIRPKEGIGLIYVVPDEASGFNWHSRTTPEGLIEVNTANPDLIQADLLGVSKLTDYVAVLVENEFTCALLEPAAAKLFHDRFEDTFLRFWKATFTK